MSATLSLGTAQRKKLFNYYPVRGGRYNEVHPGAVDVWPDTYRAARRTWEAEGSLTAGLRLLREIPG